MDITENSTYSRGDGAEVERYRNGAGARSFVYAPGPFDLVRGIYLFFRYKETSLERELAFLEKLAREGRGRESCLERDD